MDLDRTRLLSIDTTNPNGHRLFRATLGTLASFIVLLLVSSGASAATYTYAGNNFTAGGGSHTTSDSINISVTLSITLGGNLDNFDALASVTSFTAGDGFQVHTESESFISQRFVVDTDAAGDIVRWDWYSETSPSFQIQSCTLGVAATACDFLFFSPADVAFANFGGEAFVLNDPGTWATVVPEPSSALLIAMGLAGLASRGRDRTEG